MTIEDLNKRETLPDAKIQWCGSYVLLHHGNTATSFKPTADLQARIFRWCAHNGYRCTQMHDGKIWL